MEETYKWIAGICISLLGLLTTMTIANKNRHKSTHKDLYDKLDGLEKNKASKKDLIALGENIDEKVKSHITESASTSLMLLRVQEAQTDLIRSIDDKMNILLKRL